MDVKDLKPGDILLYSPDKWASIGGLISIFTLSPVCHAGLYMGVYEGEGKVAEEGFDGLKQYNLSDSFGHRRIYVRRLPKINVMDPVIKVAQGYLGHREKYGKWDILLLAASILSTDFEKLAVIFQLDIDTKWMEWVECLRAAAKNAAWLLKLFYDKTGHHPMICSQFVYTCYDEAGDDYKLNVIPSVQSGNTLLSHAEKYAPKAVSLPQGIFTEFFIEEVHKAIVKICEEFMKILFQQRTAAAASVPGVTGLPEDVLETLKSLDDALRAGEDSDKNLLGDPSFISYLIKPSDLYDRCINTEPVGIIQL